MYHYNSGEDVTIEGGGGEGGYFCLGGNFTRNFGLSADVGYQESTVYDSKEESGIGGSFSRWYFQLTPRFIIPIKRRCQFNIGAGPGLYTTGMMFLSQSNSESLRISYNPAFGFHSLLEFKISLAKWISLGCGLTYYSVKYNANEVLSDNIIDVSDLKSEFRNLNGAGFDFFLGFSIKF